MTMMTVGIVCFLIQESKRMSCTLTVSWIQELKDPFITGNTFETPSLIAHDFAFGLRKEQPRMKMWSQSLQLKRLDININNYKCIIRDTSFTFYF